MINCMNRLLNALGIREADSQVDDFFEPVSHGSIERSTQSPGAYAHLDGRRQEVQNFSQTVLEAATLIQQTVIQPSY